jgi:Flp pilus assembly protein TadG
MLKKIKNRLKEESGQALVFLAITAVALLGFGAMAVDVGRVSVEKTNLQDVADAAALAGAYELPTAASARAAAIDNGEKNGLDEVEITVNTPYNGDSTKVEVICTKHIDYTLARVLGYTETDITARAVAQKSGMAGGPFGYAVFSGSDSDTLTINGSSQNITGSVHTNYRFSMNGSAQYITGSVGAVNRIKINGSSISVTGTCQAPTINVNGSSISIGQKVYTAAPVIAMPDFSEEIEALAISGGTYYTGNKSYNGSSLNVDTPIYVNGNLSINGSSFSGTGMIVATGNITFNGSNLKYSGTDAVCFYSVNGDITINGSSARLDGMLYAPNGDITMNGSSQTINGRVIANTVTFNGSSLTITAGANDLEALPSSTVTLVE